MNKVGSDKCQTNHKVGQPFTEIIWPFSDEILRPSNYFILSQTLSLKTIHDNTIT